MPANGNLPIEVGLEKARFEIVQAIGQIGDRYSIPSSLLLILLENIVNESKLATFTNILAGYDISNPTPVKPSVPTQIPSPVPEKKDEVKTNGSNGRSEKPVKRDKPGTEKS